MISVQHPECQSVENFKLVRLWIACEGTGVSTGGRAHRSLSFAVQTKESNSCVSFRANAGNWARRGTERDLESVTAVKKVNAWIHALLTTDRDPASVMPDKKRKIVTTVI